MNIYNALIYKKLYGGGGGGEIEVESLTATENKTYNAGEGKAYNPVVVAIPEPTLISKNITANGNYSASADNADGYSSVSVNVPLPENAYLLQTIEHEQVATFTDGTDNFVKALEVAIEPQQDLHGYDNPWVGGAGKNKYEGSPSFDEYVNLSTWTKDSTTYNGHEVYKKDSLWNGLYKMITLPTGTYTFSCMAKSDNDVQATLYFSGKDGTAVTEPLYEKVNLTTSWQRVSGSFTVTTGGTIALRLEKSANVDGNVYVSEYQVESGSSATSYAPYENECPISGWSAVNVTVADDVDNPTTTETITIQLGDTYYGGKLDVVSGIVTPAPYYASYNGEALTGEWISDRDKYEVGTTPTIGAQVVNIGASDTPVSITPTIIKSLQGDNNLFASTGEIERMQYWGEVTS